MHIDITRSTKVDVCSAEFQRAMECDQGKDSGIDERGLVVVAVHQDE